MMPFCRCFARRVKRSIEKAQIKISGGSSTETRVAGVRALRMHDDTFDPVDQFQRAILPVLQRRRCLAPAAIEDRIGGRDTGGRRRIIRAHDSDENADGGSGVATRHRANFGQRPCLRCLSGDWPADRSASVLAFEIVTQAKISHKAIAIRPAVASDIRYAVIVSP